jgi:hypothetical protein
MECIKVNDFCFLKKYFSEKPECNGKYNASCYSGLCANHQSKCQSLILLRAIKNIYKYVKDYDDFKKEYDSFINQIKDCPEPPKLNSNDYCLSKQNRYLSCISTSARIWSFTQIKQNECKCTGKYSYRCNNEYCAKNKQACDDLRNRSINGIKKCKS